MTNGGIESPEGMDNEAMLDVQPALTEDAPEQAGQEIIKHFADWENDQFPTEQNALPELVTATNVEELLTQGADIAPEIIEGIKNGNISLSA